MHLLPCDFDTAQTALADLRPARLVDIAARLGYPPSAVGMLSDVLRGRREHISERRLRDLRRRLGLDAAPKVYWRPCLPLEWRDSLTPADIRAACARLLEEDKDK